MVIVPTRLEEKECVELESKKHCHLYEQHVRDYVEARDTTPNEEDSTGPRCPKPPRSPLGSPRRTPTPKGSDLLRADPIRQVDSPSWKPLEVVDSEHRSDLLNEMYIWDRHKLLMRGQPVDRYFLSEGNRVYRKNMSLLTLINESFGGAPMAGDALLEVLAVDSSVLRFNSIVSMGSLFPEAKKEDSDDEDDEDEDEDDDGGQSDGSFWKAVRDDGGVNTSFDGDGDDDDATPLRERRLHPRSRRWSARDAESSVASMSSLLPPGCSEVESCASFGTALEMLLPPVRPAGRSGACDDSSIKDYLSVELYFDDEGPRPTQRPPPPKNPGATAASATERLAARSSRPCSPILRRAPDHGAFTARRQRAADTEWDPPALMETSTTGNEATLGTPVSRSQQYRRRPRTVQFVDSDGTGLNTDGKTHSRPCGFYLPPQMEKQWKKHFTGKPAATSLLCRERSSGNSKAASSPHLPPLSDYGSSGSLASVGDSQVDLESLLPKDCTGLKKRTLVAGLHRRGVAVPK